jgi:hypothetical protein
MIVAGVTITIDDDAGEEFGAVAPNCVHHNQPTKMHQPPENFREFFVYLNRRKSSAEPMTCLF